MQQLSQAPDWPDTHRPDTTEQLEGHTASQQPPDEAGDAAVSSAAEASVISGTPDGVYPQLCT